MNAIVMSGIYRASNFSFIHHNLFHKTRGRLMFGGLSGYSLLFVLWGNRDKYIKVRWMKQ